MKFSIIPCRISLVTFFIYRTIHAIISNKFSYRLTTQIRLQDTFPRMFIIRNNTQNILVIVFCIFIASNLSFYIYISREIAPTPQRDISTGFGFGCGASPSLCIITRRPFLPSCPGPIRLSLFTLKANFCLPSFPEKE